MCKEESSIYSLYTINKGALLQTQQETLSVLWPAFLPYQESNQIWEMIFKTGTRNRTRFYFLKEQDLELGFQFYFDVELEKQL
jgi:hypothetical protein